METRQNFCVSDSSTCLCYNIAILEVIMRPVPLHTTPFCNVHPGSYRLLKNAIGTAETQRRQRTPPRAAASRSAIAYSLIAPKPTNIPILSSLCPLCAGGDVAALIPSSPPLPAPRVFAARGNTSCPRDPDTADAPDPEAPAAAAAVASASASASGFRALSGSSCSARLAALYPEHVLLQVGACLVRFPHVQPE